MTAIAAIADASDITLWGTREWAILAAGIALGLLLANIIVTLTTPTNAAPVQETPATAPVPAPTPAPYDQEAGR